MKTFIFCGGKATRFNNGKPGPLKPLIKINKIPIILRIINNLKKNSINEIFLLGGYKFNKLKSFFKKNKMNIVVIDTKINTSTAGRLLMIKNLITKNENFLLTYGDSLVDFDIESALSLKKKNTFVISSYKYKFMYGVLNSNKRNICTNMYEKKIFSVNSGFYILDKKIFKFIRSKKESFESDVIPRVLRSKKINFKINYVQSWLPIDNNTDKKNANLFLKNEK
jgi:glucose-1-phosphate cytidylyltransferase